MSQITHLALWILLLCDRPFPPQQRWQTHHRRKHPNRGNHRRGSLWGPLLQILDCLGNAPEPVQTNQAQIVNTGRAQQHVHRGVYVAPQVPKRPVAHQLVRQRERHYHQSEKKIRHRQTGNKPVLYVLERLFRHYSYYHQHVAHHYDYHQNHHQNASNYYRQQAVVRGQALPVDDVGLVVVAQVAHDPGHEVPRVRA